MGPLDGIERHGREKDWSCQDGPWKWCFEDGCSCCCLTFSNHYGRIIWIKNINSSCQFALSHAESVQEPSSRAPRESAQTIHKNKHRTSASFSSCLQELPDPEPHCNTWCTCCGVPFHYIRSCIIWWSIAIAVVQGSIIGLINPLPKNCIEWSRGGKDEPACDRNIHWEEGVPPHDPRQNLTCIRMDCQFYYRLCKPQFFDLFWTEQDLSFASQFEMLSLFFFLFVYSSFHFADLGCRVY